MQWEDVAARYTSMLTGIDHLVVAVPDLDAAMANYRALGFTVVRGGRHPVATHNALIAFADGAYIELIGFYEADPTHRWWEPLQRGGGLVDFCMGTDALPDDAAAFRGAGMRMADPRPLSRVRPDGYTLQWVLAIPEGAQRGVAPFLIQDETPRAERVPSQTVHPNGVTGVGTITVAVEDSPAVRRWYAAALRRPGHDIRRDELDGAGVRFTIGPHTFDFVSPRSPASPLAGWIRDRGPSPYAATLRSASGRSGPLDPAKTLGARLSLAQEDDGAP